MTELYILDNCNECNGSKKISISCCGYTLSEEHPYCPECKEVCDTDNKEDCYECKEV